MRSFSLALIIGLLSTAAFAQNQQQLPSQSPNQPLNRGVIQQQQQGNVTEQSGNPQMADPNHQQMTTAGPNTGTNTPNSQQQQQQYLTAGGQPLTTSQDQGCTVVVNRQTSQHVMMGSCPNISVKVE